MNAPATDGKFYEEYLLDTDENKSWIKINIKWDENEGFKEFLDDKTNFKIPEEILDRNSQSIKIFQDPFMELALNIRVTLGLSNTEIINAIRKGLTKITKKPRKKVEGKRSIKKNEPMQEDTVVQDESIHDESEDLEKDEPRAKRVRFMDLEDLEHIELDIDGILL
jgi:hypothetical protein